MRTLQILSGAAWIALWPALGCGGRTLSSADGDTGPLAMCGDNCSPIQIAASCAEICDKLAQVGCDSENSNNCKSSCPDLASMTGSCVQTVSAVLRCFEAAVPTCSAGQPFGAQCGSEQAALEACLNGGNSGATPTTPGAGPPAGVGGNVPDSVCPGIPRPAGNGAMACSGSESAMAGAGANTTLTCSTSCQDGANNVWQADCSGSTCNCTYNGGQACTCAMIGSGSSAGSCISCCPGTN